MFSKLFKSKSNKSSEVMPDLMAADPNQVSSSGLQIANQSAFPQDITTNQTSSIHSPNNQIINNNPSVSTLESNIPQILEKNSIPIDLMSSSEPDAPAPKPEPPKPAPIPKKICSKCGGQNVHTNTQCVHCNALIN